MKTYNAIIGSIVMLTMLSCTSTRSIPIQKNALEMHLDTSQIYANSFFGIELYDLEEEKTLFSKNNTKYFIPASNTKLLTMYACLKRLQDSVPSIKYIENDSALIFWGMGDPTLLHPYFDNTRLVYWLNEKGKSKKIIQSFGHSVQPHFGKGWMWDDYDEEYQVEISSLPIHGNIIVFEKANDQWEKYPNIDFFEYNENTKSKYISRAIFKNTFTLPKIENIKPTFYQEVPIFEAQINARKLLSSYTETPIDSTKIAIQKKAKILYSIELDTVLRRLMKISDNMLAEQMLLAATSIHTDTFSTRSAINHIINEVLPLQKQKLFWADGSGLSRYNMMTPNHFVELLKIMHKEFDVNRLYSILPSGGQEKSTLGGLYTDSKPYIFAKSGSMTGVYNLSGYIITNKGKTLAFSIMNNNFPHRVSEVRKEVEKTLNIVRAIY